jgi:hypothetical protein
MLTDLHTAIRSLLYRRGRIPPDEVDVRFELPTRQWVDSLTRPTISCYLFGVEENAELRHMSMRTANNGARATHWVPPRRMDVRFMISVFTTEIADEHLLVWRVLATLMRHQQFPVELLPESLQDADPPISMQVSKTDNGPNLNDIWSALELSPRPALYYVVTMPLDLEFVVETPLVLTRRLRAKRHDEDAAPLDAVRIGGVVRDQQRRPLAGATVAVAGRAESAVTDDTGRFRLGNLSSGSVELRVTDPAGTSHNVTFEIPSDSYDITLDAATT